MTVTIDEEDRRNCLSEARLDQLVDVAEQLENLWMASPCPGVRSSLIRLWASS